MFIIILTISFRWKKQLNKNNHYNDNLFYNHNNYVFEISIWKYLNTDILNVSQSNGDHLFLSVVKHGRLRSLRTFFL